MIRSAIIAFSFAVIAAGGAHAEEPNRDTPLFDRNSQAIDRNMQTGNDRSPPLGQGPGERLRGGGAEGGGFGPGSDNERAVNQRGQ